jgi:hypothetical protein
MDGVPTFFPQADNKEINVSANQQEKNDTRVFLARVLGFWRLGDQILGTNRQGQRARFSLYYIPTDHLIQLLRCIDR